MPSDKFSTPPNSLISNLSFAHIVELLTVEDPLIRFFYEFECIRNEWSVKIGDFFITDWLRNRNTLEFIGIWEKVYIPNFNYGEFAIIKIQAGLNSFKISIKEFVAKTNAISLQAKAGRYVAMFA